MTEEYFVTRFSPDIKRAKVWKKLTPFFQKYVGPDDVVLEVGAGYCFFINQIHAKRKIAVDIFADLERFANSDVEAHCVDARNLEFLEPESIDLIFASNFLEHFDWIELETLMSEFGRILKPGAKIVVMQPNFRLAYRNYFDDYTHKTIFTDQSICDWFKSKGYFTIKRQARFMPFSIKQSTGSLHWLIPIYLRSPIKPFAGQMMLVFKKEERS